MMNYEHLSSHHPIIPFLTPVSHWRISAAQQRLQRSRTLWRRCVKGGGLAEAKEVGYVGIGWDQD
jgi:hypothetical protein